MRAARRLLLLVITLLGIVWVAAVTSHRWTPRDGNLGWAIIVVGGFAIAHVVALGLQITGAVMAANDLVAIPAARTTSGYATFAASGLVAAAILAYLGYFFGLWKT